MDASHSKGTTRRLASALPVAGDLALGLVGVAAVAAAVRAVLGLGWGYLLLPVALYAAQAGLILRAAPAELPGAGVGPANRVTLLRSLLALPVAGLALPGAFGGAAVAAEAWTAVALATAALALDGVDGAVARRTGTATALGARWDMELDAFLMLALSVLVWQHGRAGPWVLLIGALRYLFVGAGWIWPALRAPLPPSFRRKAVCVVQGVALLVALGPAVPATLAWAAVAGALLLLVASFGADVAWLIGRDRGRVTP